jgi:hypothetical protein
MRTYALAIAAAALFALPLQRSHREMSLGRESGAGICSHSPLSQVMENRPC